MALPIPIPAVAAAVCLDPSGKIRPFPVVVIRMLPVTSSAVPDVTAAVLMPTLLVVTVIAPRVEALPTIVMFDAVTAPVTVRPPVTVAPVDVNATAPIVDAEPVAVMLVTVIVSAEMLPLTVKVDAVTSVKFAFCANNANVPLVAGNVIVMLPL